MSRMSLGLVAALALALVLPAAASAAKPITGVLAKRGYTVVAVGYDGSAVTSRARAFRIKPGARKVTLHLRDRRGKYAGPIVVRRRGKLAVVGVRAGAKLGRIAVARGYARTARPLAKRFADARRTARLRKGAPLGNGRNYGLVRSRAGGASAPGADRDADGVPNVLDVDADGDLVLNPLERAGAAAAATAQELPPPEQLPEPQSTTFDNFSQLFLELDETVNANAAAVTDAQIDAALARTLQVIFLNVPEGTELDCGGLTYCSAGGTGATNAEPWRSFPGTPFPGDTDTDGDGLGTMPVTERSEFRLTPNATTARIGAGDTMIQHRPDGTQLPGLLAFVFNTVPALTTWSDGSGASGRITYPVADGAPGTSPNPLTIHRDAAGDYTLTYTFWRPQRRAIASAGERGEYIDIGGLEYEVSVPNVPRSPSAQPGSGQSPQCPAEALSTSDPELRLAPNGPFGRVADLAPDRPADAANRLTFTVNLSRCAELRGGSLQPGDLLNMDIAALPADPQSFDHANQIIWLRMG